MPSMLRKFLASLSRLQLGLAALGLFLLAASVFLSFPAQPARVERALFMEQHAALWFGEERPLSALMGLRPGAVTEAGIGGDYLLLSQGEKHFYVRLPAVLRDASSLQKLLPAGVPVYALDDRLSPQHRSALARALPLRDLALLLALLLFVALIATVMKGALSPFRVLRPSRDEEGFDRVIGAGSAKRALEDIVTYLRDRHAFSRLGARAPKGVIMEGPPGTGKTMLARALAAEAGANFVALSGSDFSSKFVGVGVSRVKSLFKTARAKAPCIVFIDEIDGIGRRTGEENAVGAENNRIINALLVELDGYHQNDGVIVVGATNYADLLDAGLRREGRFDRSCRLELPDRDSREKLFRRQLELLQREAQQPVAGELDFALLARLSTGLSPAGIATVVNAAAVMAAKEGAARLATAHVQRAIERHRIGDASDQRLLNDTLRQRIAVHEAGHAVIGHLSLPGIRVEKVTILPQGQALGVTLFSEEELVPLATASDIRARLEMILAGRAAEILYLGEASTGAAQDLEQATRLAIQMAGAYSAHDGAPELALNALPPVLQEARGRAVTTEALAVLQAAHESALEKMRAHEAVMQRLIRVLLERDEVAGEELEWILRAPRGAELQLELDVA
ncbi:MAG: AAA family ATPase [Pseudomonadota bacterium]